MGKYASFKEQILRKALGSSDNFSLIFGEEIFSVLLLILVLTQQEIKHLETQRFYIMGSIMRQDPRRNLKPHGASLYKSHSKVFAPSHYIGRKYQQVV